MGINLIGNRTSSGTMPVGSIVQGIVNDPAYLQMNGQIVSRVDYPKLHTAFDSIPLPYFEDQAVPAFGTTEAYDITYGNSKYVAIGAGGKFATSTDGVSWTLQSGSITATILSFANGIFYAGGTGGRLYSSTDGITWTQRLNVSGNRFGRVVYNGSNGYFVSGTNGDVYSSTNGTTWNSDFSTVPDIASGTDVSDVVWDTVSSRLFFITKEDGVYYRWRLVWSGSDLTSDDLDVINITGFTGTLEHPANILKFGSNYICFGKTTGNYKVLYSTDLITWSESTGGVSGGGGSSNYRLAQDGSTRIVLVRSNYIMTSTNGTTWTQQTTSFGSSDVRGVARGSSAWAAVGAGNKFATANNTATTWTQQTSPFTATSTVQANDITTDGISTWMLVGNTGKVAYSEGGASWNESTTGLSNAINAVAYGESTWVLATTTEVPKYSTNLTSWTNVTGLPSATYNYMKYCGGNFVTYRASTGFYFSADGITWSASTTVFTLSNTTGDAVACNGTRIVAVNGSTIHTSTDGDTWVSYTHGTGITFINVYWNGTYFIAAPSTASTTLYRSVDGISWELITPTVSVLPTSAAGGVFLAAAHVSEDGVNWFSTTYGQTTNAASIGQEIKVAGNGLVKNGTGYNYNTSEQVFIPLAPNQTATIRTYVKAK